MSADKQNLMASIVAGIATVVIAQGFLFRSDRVSNLPALYAAAEDLKNRLDRLERRIERLENRTFQ